MKIVLLGTGASECIPAFGCSCPTCLHARKAGGRNRRNNSSLLIDDGWGLGQILIDMPPEISGLLNRNGISDLDIETVFFTHRHQDHIGGGRYLFQRRPKKNFRCENGIDVYMPASTLRYFEECEIKNKQLGRRLCLENTQVHVIASYDLVCIRDVEIRALESNHLRMKQSSDECFGYLIRNHRGASVAYLLDAGSGIPEKTLKFLHSARPDILIADCTFFSSENPGHMDTGRVVELHDRVRPVKTIVSHIGHSNKPHEDLVQHFSGTGIEVGYDGMTITL